MPKNEKLLYLRLPKPKFKTDEPSNIITREIMPIDFTVKTIQDRAYNLYPSHLRKQKKYNIDLESKINK